MSANEQKQLENARLAHLKATQQRVFISGIAGEHSLETGVAYHYRGHYLYTPALNPIEPVPYSTRKGINIVGTRKELAPQYDPAAPTLVSEYSIFALERAKWHVWRETAEAERESRKEVERAVAEGNGEGMRARIGSEDWDGEAVDDKDMEMSIILRTGTHDLRSLPGESTTPLPARSASYISLASTVVPGVAYDQQLSHCETSTKRYGLVPTAVRASSHQSLASLALHNRNRVSSATRLEDLHSGSSHGLSMSGFAPTYGTTYTPHDRALFLADSAPGSRLASVSNTPMPSRPVSPTSHSPARYIPGHGFGHLRAIASISRLSTLLDEEGVRRPASPLSEVMEEDWLDPAEMNDYIARYSRPSSRLVSPFSPPHSRNKPVGTGRPRRASMALNEAYNAAHPPVYGGEGSLGVVRARIPKCALHGEKCDGVTVTETYRTQHAKNTSGFRDLYPVVDGAGGRQMVDWYGLLRDEQDKRSG